MNLPYAEACFNIAVGSLDKWASITRVFHPLIKIYGQTFFFSSSMRILPLPLLPLLLSFLFAEIRRHRHQLSRHALRVRDIDNFTIIQQYNFITIQFSKIRISSPPDFTRLSNTFHSFLFIHRADWHDFEFYLPFEGREGVLRWRSARHIDVCEKTLSKFTYREYELRYEDNWPGFLSNMYRENKVLFCIWRRGKY